MSNSDTELSTVPRYHAVGIGAGPANLSLAALFESATSESIALFDGQDGTAWHNQLIHSGVRMQTSWLKDLVTMIDPRHELTFINYMVTTGRMIALMNSQFDVIPRLEYIRYLEWAAAKLKNVHYGVYIDRISLNGDGFVVYSDGRPMARSEHLVLGMGTAPFIPAGFAGLPPDRAFIAEELADRLPSMVTDLDAPVGVVGAGQTGLEAAWELMNRGFTDIKWFGRRLWFDTFDDAPGANDVYRPAHFEALQRLSPPTRARIVKELMPTGHAMTPASLKGIYQANYERMLQLGHFPIRMYPSRHVISAYFDDDQCVLDCQGLEQQEQYKVRHVVIAAGRANPPVPFDDELRQRVEVDADGELMVEPDFSVRWKGMNGHGMYALNRARAALGLTDTNLSLLPVRAAIVLNSMFGRQLFDIKDELCPVNWG